MTIKRKLNLSLIGLMALGVFIASAAVFSVFLIGSHIFIMADRLFPISMDAADISTHALAVRVYAKTMVYADNTRDIETAGRNIKVALGQIADIARSLHNRLPDNTDTNLTLTRINDKLNRLDAAQTRLLTLSLARRRLNEALTGDYTALTDILQRDFQVFGAARPSIDRQRLKKILFAKNGLIESQRRYLAATKALEGVSEDFNATAQSMDAKARQLSVVIRSGTISAGAAAQKTAGVTSAGIVMATAISIIFGFILVGILSSFISRRMDEMSGWISHFSRELSSKKSDLTQRLPDTAGDEMAAVGKAFNSFLDNFAGMTRIIKIASGKIEAGSHGLVDIAGKLNKSVGEVNASVGQVVLGVNSQMRQIEESNSLIGNLENSLRGISRNAEEAAKVVNESSKLADDGRHYNDELMAKIDSIIRVAGAAVSAVNNLSERSEAIVDITTTIDSFADQTNLLSLNAAIEAARAGESGRGFAVVADEIRKLAEASSSSAGQIHTMVASIREDLGRVVSGITASRRESENGKNIAGQVSLMQEKISTASRVAQETVSGIARGIPAQLEEAGKVLAAITDVNEVSQQNLILTAKVSANFQSIASYVKELSFGAQELTEVVAQLRQLTGDFKV